MGIDQLLKNWFPKKRKKADFEVEGLWFKLSLLCFLAIESRVPRISNKIFVGLGFVYVNEGEI